MSAITARLLRSSSSLLARRPLMATVAASRTVAPAFQTVWSRNLSDSLKGKIDQAVKDHEVLVFMKGNKDAPQCGFSRAVVQILQLQGVKDFKTVNVLADEEVRSGIKEYTSWPTIPQVFVKGEFVGGCDILINMHQSGELDSLLREKGVVTEAPAAADAAEAKQ
ncbi:thioredoxin-like protein [Fimicolochytrium jonesii]|uniref:thioredoxin-like protein n=1 Tax=Fimicolochytrium jonesii TaxID=1396493 RepID=UPI0022FDF436|nr:thioredoxin-like protein [Fimicolochytrium jonesii]KAI8819987.1 thioredoxin-like protein [Fimicolochytrium jonesii]